MKTQNLYETLEQEIKERKDNLTSQSWRGDLSRRGTDNIQFGDLNYIQSEVLNKQKCKTN